MNHDSSKKHKIAICKLSPMLLHFFDPCSKRKISTTNIYLTTNFDQIIWYWSHQEWKKTAWQKEERVIELVGWQNANGSNYLNSNAYYIFVLKSGDDVERRHVCPCLCLCLCDRERERERVYVDMPGDRSEMNRTKHTKQKICHH